MLYDTPLLLYVIVDAVTVLFARVLLLRTVSSAKGFLLSHASRFYAPTVTIIPSLPYRLLYIFQVLILWQLSVLIFYDKKEDLSKNLLHLLSFFFVAQQRKIPLPIP